MKPARDWAHDIMMAKSRDAKLAIFNQVPSEMQGIVKTHVTNATALRKFWSTKPKHKWPACIVKFMEAYG